MPEKCLTILFVPSHFNDFEFKLTDNLHIARYQHRIEVGSISGYCLN